MKNVLDMLTDFEKNIGTKAILTIIGWTTVCAGQVIRLYRLGDFSPGFITLVFGLVTGYAGYSIHKNGVRIPYTETK